MARNEILVMNGYIYPCTITQSRYGGVHSGSSWLAFPLRPTDLPEGWDGGDLECKAFWKTYPELVGKGDSPQAALKNLEKKCVKKGSFSKRDFEKRHQSILGKLW